MSRRKRLLRWVLVVLAAVAAVLFGFFVFVEIRGVPSYPLERIELKVEITPERVARGKKLSSLLCAECHGDPTTQRLSGKLMVDAPPEFGPIYAKNITQHPEKGIGQWTDGEIAYLVRTGVNRKGKYVPPPMPKLTGLSDEDLASIIAFLRSDDPSVVAADVDDRESEPTFLVKFLCLVAFKPKPYPKQPTLAPSTGDKLAYGKYLADNLECYQCHSKDFKSNRQPPETSDGYMGGGNMLLELSGKKIYSPNITMDEPSGIGKWNDAQFRRAMKDGFRPDDSPVLYPMPKYVDLDEDELNSIYAYLKTVPKLVNRRPPAEAQPRTGLTGGEAIYYKYRCDSCHGDKGVGSCDLRESDKKYPGDLLAAFIKKPQATLPKTKMPSWEGIIKDEELGPLADYVRTLKK